MKRLRFVAIVALATVAAACGGGSGTNSSSGNSNSAAGGSSSGSTSNDQGDGRGVKLGGTLKAARAADVVTWDPAHINENDSLWAAFQTNGNLLMASPDGKGFQPYIAKSWKQSADGKTYTFTLNPAAKFCDGTQITSADVAFSFKRASAKDAIVSWQYPVGMHVKTPDPETVVIKLPTPNASFLSYMTLWGTAIVSQAYAQKVGDPGLAAKPLGSGPFCLANWQKGTQITLKRNPHFWLKDAAGNRLPYLDEVDWQIIKDDNARVVALQSGQVDAVTALPPAQFAQLKSSQNIKTGESTALATVSLFASFRNPALADQRVRQALNYATDKQGIIKNVLFGLGKPALSPLFLANYTNESYGYPYDMAKAKQLMAQSKFPHGFSAKVTYTAGDATAQQTLTILKAQWAQLGVKISLAPVEEGVYFNTWSSGKWDMIWVKATNDIYDPAENLHFSMMGKEGGSDSGWTGFEDLALNKLVLEAEREVNQDKRAALYNQIQQTYMAEGPQIYLYHPDNIWATSDKVDGFRIYPTGLHPLMYTHLRA
jgi:peptide/nickel transport system substrate-binding protein